MDEEDAVFLETVVRFETSLWNRLDRELAAMQQPSVSTVVSLRALARLGREGRVHDLSGALSITVGAASKLVDRMERDGLAVRRPHPEDRRSSLIELTDRGQEVERGASVALSATVARLLPDPAARAALISAIEVLQPALRLSGDRHATKAVLS